MLFSSATEDGAFKWFWKESEKDPLFPMTVVRKTFERKVLQIRLGKKVHSGLPHHPSDYESNTGRDTASRGIRKRRR